MLQPLPITPWIPEILARIRERRAAVITAARSHSNREMRQKALEILSESDSPKAQAMIDSMLR